ncbi:MAG: hypothetical protein NTY12_02390 [Candidatus Falkowbacteria bacterium]|nr:hypothetical protein [Candidatus Falkowbacteria bacterium]
MYRHFLTSLIAIVAVAFLDAVFVGSLPFGLHRLHLLPLALIFVLLLSNIRLASWWALVGGLVLELFSFRFFGSYLIILFIVLAIIQFMFEKVITNRSIYSIVIISAVVTVVWDLFFLVVDYQTEIIAYGGLEIIKIMILSLIANILAASLTFYTINAFSRRFRPVFLSFRK